LYELIVDCGRKREIARGEAMMMESAGMEKKRVREKGARKKQSLSWNANRHLDPVIVLSFSKKNCDKFV
jgi:superfamily II RNA helicase